MNGGTKPGRGRPCCFACCDDRAIMPATSGVEALVPPTKVMPCCGEFGQLLTPLEHTIG